MSTQTTATPSQNLDYIDLRDLYNSLQILRDNNIRNQRLRGTYGYDATIAGLGSRIDDNQWYPLAYPMNQEGIEQMILHTLICLDPGSEPDNDDPAILDWVAPNPIEVNDKYRSTLVVHSTPSYQICLYALTDAIGKQMFHSDIQTYYARGHAIFLVKLQELINKEVTYRLNQEGITKLMMVLTSYLDSKDSPGYCL